MKKGSPCHPSIVATPQPWLCSHSLESHSTCPKGKITLLLSRGCTHPVKEVVQTEGQGIPTTLEPGSFLPGVLKSHSRGFASNSNDTKSKPHARYQSGMSPAAPHKGTERRSLSYPTWEAQPHSPKTAGPPRWSSKMIGASV